MSWHRRRPAPRPPLTSPDRGARPATDGGELLLPRLPHERDEHASEPKAPTLPIRLAIEDLDQGRVDTDCRGATPAAECAGELPALLKPRPEPTRRQT